MKKRIAVIVLMVMGLCAGAFATEAITTGDGSIVGLDTAKPVQRYSVLWTSDVSGDFVAVIGPIFGTINRVMLVADATDTPTTDYDVTIEDEDGYDLTVGEGADISTATTSVCLPCVVMDGPTSTTHAVAVAGELTVTVANAGAANKGIIRVYLEQLKP